MAARRSTGRHDPVGIDAQLGGVLPHPSDCTLGVLDAFPWRDALSGLHSVVGPGRNHATAGEMCGLGFELLDAAIGPAATEENTMAGRLSVSFQPGG
jgi:hypothetical protein